MSYRSSMESPRPLLYLAAPLFTESERLFNTTVKQTVQCAFDVYLPQEDGGLMVDMIRDGMTPCDAAQIVFAGDVRAIDRCDVLLIVLDGRTVDEGASFELGYAYSKHKTCYALQTDPRRLLQTGNNPMIDGACTKVFTSLEELTVWAVSLAGMESPQTIAPVSAYP